jgi:hypothetical protein
MKLNVFGVLVFCWDVHFFVGNIRNLAMEKVASTVMFPCKYSTSGCAVSLLHTEKGEHEETCEFRPYSCPCPGASCKWQGSLEQVMPHLMMSHKSITTLQGNKTKFETFCIMSLFSRRWCSHLGNLG